MFWFYLFDEPFSRRQQDGSLWALAQIIIKSPIIWHFEGGRGGGGRVQTWLVAAVLRSSSVPATFEISNFLFPVDIFAITLKSQDIHTNT